MPLTGGFVAALVPTAGFGRLAAEILTLPSVVLFGVFPADAAPPDAGLGAPPGRAAPAAALRVLAEGGLLTPALLATGLGPCEAGREALRVAAEAVFCALDPTPLAAPPVLDAALLAPPAAGSAFCCAPPTVLCAAAGPPPTALEGLTAVFFCALETGPSDDMERLMFSP